MRRLRFGEVESWRGEEVEEGEKWWRDRCKIEEIERWNDDEVERYRDGEAESVYGKI